MGSLEDIVGQFIEFASTNTNINISAVKSNGTAAHQPLAGLPSNFSDISSIFTFLLSFGALGNWGLLLVLGSSLESLRQGLSVLWKAVIDSFFLTARFHEDDSSFDWMMLWLSKQPSIHTARDVEISTRTHYSSYNGDGDGRKHMRIPSASETYTIWYRRRWIRVTREIKEGNWRNPEQTLVLRIFTWNQSIIDDIVLEAKKMYYAEREDKVQIYVSNSNCSDWRSSCTLARRPPQSIILEPGVQELVLEDAKDFMTSKSWYAERGIPFRRGYLLYGAPGAGKTSLIHSIAGELKLDVYILSLSRSGMDDSSLSELISELPEKCIALMEDIDAAFHHGLTREGPSSEDKDDNGPPEARKLKAASSSSKISLSGLLNALDGIGAQEGRLLFATTNKYSALDPALCRPGRMDLHIEFRNASRYQAEELFKRFYLPSGSLPGRSSEAASAKPYKDDDLESTDSGYGASPAESEKLVDIGDDAASGSASPSRSSFPEKPSYIGVSHNRRAPEMSSERFRELASRFADAIPERKLSMAALQGYLMTYKIRPDQAVEDVAAWVERELAQKDADSEDS